MTLQKGDMAEDFELSSHDGTSITLSSYKNSKNVVLCFYPKNHLFACPSKKVFEMAKSVISVYSEIIATETVVFAISVDSVNSQLPPCSAARSTMTEPSRMDSTMPAVMSFGASLPGMSAVVIMMSTSIACFAKVIAFDIQFDSPDRQSEYLKGIRKNLNERGFSDLVPGHGDSIFANSIINAKNNGTSVILASKLVQEATRQPPQYIQLPNEILQNSKPDYGLVNEQADRDGFSRQYYTFFTLDQNPGVWYPSLGIKAIQRYLDFPDSTLPRFNDNYTNLKYGPLQIPFFSSDIISIKVYAAFPFIASFSINLAILPKSNMLLSVLD